MSKTQENAMWDGVPEYLLLAALVAIIAHARVRRYFIACALAAAVASVFNLLHETWRADFAVNLGWGPPLYLMGFLLAFPVAGLVGMPFAYYRQRQDRSRAADTGSRLPPQ
jgi:hypothetical protein